MYGMVFIPAIKVELVVHLGIHRVVWGCSVMS
jgi:hypothetical protein